MLRRLSRYILRVLSAILLSISSYGFIQRFRRHDDGVLVRAPHELTLHEWKVALKQTWHALFDKRLLTLSGGVAFYASLALLPALAGGLALLGILVGDSESSRTLATIASYLPEEFARFLNEELSSLASSRSANVVAAIISLVLGIWTGSAASDNLMQALNAVQDRTESRGFAKFKLVSLGIVLIMITTFLLILPLLLINRHTLAANGVVPWLANGFPVLRWVLILAIISTAIALVYRYAPDKGKMHWQWISWGAVSAALLWLMGTLLFFYYVQFIADFSQAYGVLAGMFVLMAWVEMTSHIVILGAHVNYRLQRQAVKPVRKQRR